MAYQWKRFWGNTMAGKKVQVKLVRSPISTLPKHKLCVKGLGLRKIGQVVELEDTPSVRGMINKVNYLVEVIGE
ncbi:50S ribosomal protein L30 [Litoribacillus peritrichatus]